MNQNQKQSIWVIDDEHQTIKMYFPERVAHTIARAYIKSGLTRDEFADMFIDKLMQMAEMTQATTGRNIYRYKPDFEILKDEDFDTLQPTENQTAVDIEVTIKRPKEVTQ